MPKDMHNVVYAGISRSGFYLQDATAVEVWWLGALGPVAGRRSPSADQQSDVCRLMVHVHDPCLAAFDGARRYILPGRAVWIDALLLGASAPMAAPCCCHAAMLHESLGFCAANLDRGSSRCWWRYWSLPMVYKVHGWLVPSSMRFYARLGV
jgi:hypothetical protein